MRIIYGRHGIKSAYPQISKQNAFHDAATPRRIRELERMAVRLASYQM